jgi:sugar phosphate isomerase/epimerase
VAARGRFTTYAVKLRHDIHLAYCTNIHRGETWEQTFETLQKYTLAVRDRVAPKQPYAIGLRLGDQASRQLSDRATLTAFQRWLDANDCYIFTINGFPYGSFHGARVKEQVYAPDWTTDDRLAYTKRLFDLLAELVPAGLEGSVSTVPCSFKEFITTPNQVAEMRANLWRCVEHIAQVSEKSGRMLHLGLEPEPLCYLETTAETVAFFQQLRADRPTDDRLNRHLGVNYDTCHLAIEFEDAAASIRELRDNNIKISKLHFSSALKVKPTQEARRALVSFVEPVYFHQVIAKWPAGSAAVTWNKDGLPSLASENVSGRESQITRTRDLDLALAQSANLDALTDDQLPEWRIHFHIPLHSRPTELFDTTTHQILGVIDLLADNPNLCHHIEMETYTWEVLPGALKNRSVVDQLADEYAWTLDKLRARQLA